MKKNEPAIATLVYKLCLTARHNERVVIVTDPAEKHIASFFIDAAKSFTPRVREIIFDSMTENGQEPPDGVAGAIIESDIAILITTYSLSHTKARLRASENGTRIISMPGITKDILLRSVDVDYKKQIALSDKLQKILTNGSSVTVTSPGGTNLTMSIVGRAGWADGGNCDKPGDFINLPAGEAFIAPVETAANGTIVFDGAIASIELDQPITITMKNGTIQSLSGGEAAKEFEKRMTKVGPKARIIAEFGIGTNVKAKASPEILEAEKVFGTCHIAFGRNSTFGGTNDVPFHTDGLILKPTIRIDGKIIMKDGKLA